VRRRALSIGLILGLTVAGAMSGAALAAEGDSRGPRCTDIVDGGAFYPSAGVVAAEVTVANPACANVTYTLWVAPATADGTLTGPFVAITTATTDVDELGRGVVTLTGTVSGSPEAICAYAETSLGKRVRDRGPDTGCEIVLVGTTPGRAGWN
jgi:hypothetical protein